MMPSPNFGSGTMPSRFGGGHSTTKAQSLPIPEVRYSSGSRLPDVKPKISDLDAVLREDLTGSVHNIPNALFFPHILGVELDELIKWEEYFHSQMDDEELVKWMKKLCEGSSSDETFLYATFSYAANRITELSYAPGAPVVKTKNPGRCFGPNEFVWLRNDPVILKGSDADRKPDCIGTSKARRELRIRELKEAARALVSHIRSPKTTKWNDPTISVEFKRRLYRLIWALYQATARAPFSRKSPAPSQSLTVVDDAVVFPMPDTQVNKQDLENLDEISVEPTNTRPGQSPSKIAAPAPLVSKPLDELVVMSEQPNANKKRALKGTNVGSSSKKQKIDSKKGEAEEPDRTEPTCSLIEQSARYAAEMLTATGGTRVHAWCMEIDGYNMWLSVYDASGCMRSYPVNILTEFPKFAAIIAAIARFDRERWGVQTAVTYPQNADVIPESLSGATIDFQYEKHQHTATIQSTAFVRRGLFGRNTNVHMASCETLGAGPLAIKFAQPLRSRLVEFTEMKIIREASAQGVPNIPEVYDFLMLPSMSKGMRGDVYKGQVTLSNRKFKFEVASEEPKETTEAPADLVYDDRQMTVLIGKLYEPITRLESAKDLAKVFMDILLGHHKLYKDAHILHRDISVDNLMFWRDSNGTPHGILNDYDNAIFLDERYIPKHTMGPHRTGTLPFMSLDFLMKTPRNAPHYYRHDLESLLYALVWICARFPTRSRKEIAVDITNHWCKGSTKAVFCRKSVLHHDLDPDFDGEMVYSDHFSSFHGLTYELAVALNDGHSFARKERKRGKEHTDDMGGFTFDYFYGLICDLFYTLDGDSDSGSD